jgi:hypothetical protein
MIKYPDEISRYTSCDLTQIPIIGHLNEIYKRLDTFIDRIAFLNKRPMGHIAHLSNTGSYENTFRILIYTFHFLLPPLTPRGP